MPLKLGVTTEIFTGFDMAVRQSGGALRRGSYSHYACPVAFGVHPLGCWKPADTLKGGHQTGLGYQNENCWQRGPWSGRGHSTSCRFQVAGLIMSDSLRLPQPLRLWPEKQAKSNRAKVLRVGHNGLCDSDSGGRPLELPESGYF